MRSRRHECRSSTQLCKEPCLITSVVPPGPKPHEAIYRLLGLPQGCPENGFPNPLVSADTPPVMGCRCLLDLRHRSFQGFLSSKKHGISSSQKLLTLLELTIPGLLTFILLFTSYRVLGCWALSCRCSAWRGDSWRVRHLERVFTGCLPPSALIFIPWLK